MPNNTHADLLEKALQDLAKKKESTKQSIADARPEMERLEAMQARLDELSYEERRQVLNAAGLQHISAAPKPITPLSTSRPRPAVNSIKAPSAPIAPTPSPAIKGSDRAPEKHVETTVTKTIAQGVIKAEILSAVWPLPNGAPPMESILDKLPKWVEEACTKTGRPGMGRNGSHLWNPAVLAICLATRTPQKKWSCSESALDKLMRSQFPDYLTEWENKKGML